MLMLVLFLAAGCNPHTQTNAYDVMFEKQPRLIDDGVYRNGNRIGTVVSNTQENLPVGRLAVTIDSAFQDVMKTNVVFYVSAGRLELAALGGYGEPLAKETKLLGFGSKASLIWFKAKYLLKNQAVEATQKADRLYRRTI
jgi:hypothetical protein